MTKLRRRSLGKCTGYCFSCPYQYPECGWEGGIDFRTLPHNIRSSEKMEAEA